MTQTLTSLQPLTTKDITALQARATVDGAIIKATELGAR